MTRIININME